MEILKKIFSVLLALWIVVPTGGVNVYTHTCTGCDSFEVSVSEIDVCCSPEIIEAETCCEKTVKETSTCCSSKDQSCDDHKSNLKKDQCCTFEQQYFKLENSFDKTRQINIVVIAHCVDLNFVNISKDIQTEKKSNQMIDISTHAPPDIFGKDMLIFLQALKVPVS